MSSLLTRRSFFFGLVVAPAIVKIASIMPVKVFDLDVGIEELEEIVDAGVASRGGGFTAAEIQNIANAAMDFYLYKAESFQQAPHHSYWKKQLSPKTKIFPGGNGNIELAVSGAYRRV